MAQKRGRVEGIQALTEKEKQTLRLIVRGHDAKSLARHLGLSVHTVNERLRDARRKLEVSSSRGAARRLLDTEGHDPEVRGDELFGDAANYRGVEQIDAPRPDRLPGPVVGACLVIFVLAIAALSVAGPSTAPQPIVATPSATSPVVDSDAVRAARHFLELGDQSRWADAYAATGASFHQHNTLKLWSDTATKVRVPLGALVSRTALSQESVPTPPAGAEIIKFRASFANKADVIETVSLAREGGEWKVIGIYLN